MAKRTVSHIRKTYIARLFGRSILFICALILYFTNFARHDILQGWDFFRKLSWLHLLWVLWIIDMVCQLIPAKDIALGSHKYLKGYFKAAKEQITPQALKNHIRATTKSAYVVMLVWVALIAVLGVLKFTGIVLDSHLFLISVAFYVCDLICVLVWCPFRLTLGNRCCTTCRIFNWDHFMMFTPMLYVKGFFSWSLLGLAIVILLIWELCVLMHPERFWEKTNAALKCSHCTDKLCTQYCQKLRKR